MGDAAVQVARSPFFSSIQRHAISGGATPSAPRPVLTTRGVSGPLARWRRFSTQSRSTPKAASRKLSNNPFRPHSPAPCREHRVGEHSLTQPEPRDNTENTPPLLFPAETETK